MSHSLGTKPKKKTLTHTICMRVFLGVHETHLARKNYCYYRFLPKFLASASSHTHFRAYPWTHIRKCVKPRIRVTFRCRFFFGHNDIKNNHDDENDVMNSRPWWERRIFRSHGLRCVSSCIRMPLTRFVIWYCIYSKITKSEESSHQTQKSRWQEFNFRK